MGQNLEKKDNDDEGADGDGSCWGYRFGEDIALCVGIEASRGRTNANGWLDTDSPSSGLIERRSKMMDWTISTMTNGSLRYSRGRMTAVSGISIVLTHDDHRHDHCVWDVTRRILGFFGHTIGELGLE